MIFVTDLVVHLKGWAFRLGAALLERRSRRGTVTQEVLLKHQASNVGM